jgi:hypothetical protein
MRRISKSSQEEQDDRAERQRRYLEDLATHIDPAVLASDEMWARPPTAVS